MTIAYFDCFSGVSGDMLLGALINAGAPLESLLGELKKLPLDGYSLQVRNEWRGSLAGTRVLIEAGEQPHRSYSDICALIDKSELAPEIRHQSLAVFRRIGEAEAHVHGVSLEAVHFHEVGAVDSILDIVGSVIALNLLGIRRVYSSRLPLGGGFVQTHHGTLPVPAPATVRLLAGIPVYDNGIRRELVTPTGAAFLATLAEEFGSFPPMTVMGSGMGIGTHPAADPPNALRMIYGSAMTAIQESVLSVMETNIDDMNPELYNYVLEGLMDLGALDVSFVPVQMKKNRPGVLLRVLSAPGLQPTLARYLFRETTTLGIRVHEVRRIELARRTVQVSTVYGPCRVKAITLPDGEERFIPEFEECRRIAQAQSVPLRRVYEDVQAEANRTLHENA
jgi:uncharacterized protein (TIGR00299 family) protein